MCINILRWVLGSTVAFLIGIALVWCSVAACCTTFGVSSNLDLSDIGTWNLRLVEPKCLPAFTFFPVCGLGFPSEIISMKGQDLYPKLNPECVLCVLMCVHVLCRPNIS